MLKYEGVVSRLSEGEKINILTDLSGLSDRELINMGIPAVRAGELASMTENIFPSPAALAGSWNCELVRRVGEASAIYMASKGVGIAITPAAKIKIDPYGTALSEDVRLAASLANSYAVGAKRGGLRPCISELGISASETAWLDRSPDERIIYEYVARPYIEALSERHVGVCIKEETLAGEYGERSQELIKMAAGGKLGEAVAVLCRNANAENTVRYINQGIICLKGSGYALQAALNKYTKIKKAIDRGEMGDEELLEDIECGNAISPEMLDAAVDRTIAFLSELMPKYVGEQEAERKVNELAPEAARESIVLLKNANGLLPIQKSASVALIGDAAVSDSAWVERICASLRKRGADVIGVARGYEKDSELPSTELSQEAIALAKRADLTLFFAGTDKEREKYITRSKNLSLPANQDILASKLAQSSAKHTVAVLSSNYAVDVATLDELGALILAPIDVRGSAEALADAVCGVYSPSGKLANSLYRNTDSSLAKQQRYMNMGAKAGRFIGYRYYDTAEWDIGYPFGHGVGYSEFAYSSLSVNGEDSVSFTLKNIGRMAAAEVVQLYVGIESSSSLRPKKELVAFDKIYLEAGQSKNVTLKLSVPLVFDVASGKAVAEKGVYNVYVGSSVSDIRLSAKLRAGDAVLAPTHEPLSRYLQSESNIISENYTLEARYPVMKKAIKNIACGAALLLLAVLLQIYCVSTNTVSAFLNVITVGMIGVAIAFFVLEAIDRKRIGEKEKEATAKANEKWFEDATKLESFDADKIFADEFGADHTPDEEEVTVTEKRSNDEYFAHVDKELTFETVSAELEIFLREHGCKLDRVSVNGLLSAMASSRIVLIQGLEKGELERLITALSQYFECSASLDRVDGSYTAPSRIFNTKDANGQPVATEALRIVDGARATREKLHICAFAELDGEVMKNCFGDIVKYAKSPYSDSVISAVEGKHRFSENIWFIGGLSANTAIADIPLDVAEAAAVTELRVTAVTPAAEPTAVHKLTYYQLEFMSEREVGQSEIGEELWKKVDRLCTFVGDLVEYSIGNKQWMSMERYVAVFVACSGDADESLDRAVAARILPSVLVLTKDVNAGLGDEIEKIFGDSGAEASRRAVRTAELNKTVKKS